MAAATKIAIEIRKLTSTNNTTRCVVADSSTRPPETIQRHGVIPVGPPRLIPFYCRAASSDITDYKKLLRTNLYSPIEYFVFITNRFQNKLIKAFATDAGAMDGINSQSETTVFTVRAYAALQTVPPTDGTGSLTCNVYHRTVAGVETRLAFVSTNLSFRTLTRFDFNVGMNQTWATNERLVVKFYGGGLSAPQPP